MDIERVKLDISMHNASRARDGSNKKDMQPVYCTLADLAHDINMTPLSAGALQEFIKEIS
jgi:hypothetical protein